MRHYLHALILLHFFIFNYAALVDHNYNIGSLKLFCPEPKNEWVQIGTECFKLINSQDVTFDEANELCQLPWNSLATLIHMYDWFLYYQLSEKYIQRNSSLENDVEFWTAWYFNSSEEGRLPTQIFAHNGSIVGSVYNSVWASLEPQLRALSRQGRLCISWKPGINKVEEYGWRVRDCAERLPAICGTFSCLEDFDGLAQHRCSDGSGCISKKAFCDGIRDCGNAEDEEGTFCNISCPENPVELHSWFGEISSPDFRHNMRGLNCQFEWIIVTQSSDTLTYLNFVFVDLIQRNALTVMDLWNRNNFTIDLPQKLVIYGERIRIKYLKNSDEQSGFFLKYHTSASEVCTKSFDFSATNGKFTPPRSLFDLNKYAANFSCYWTIENRLRGIVSIAITRFGLADGDWLAVYSGKLNDSNLMGNFSSTNVPPTAFLADSEEINFIFRSTLFSDKSYGFEVQFSRSCEEQALNMKSGSIESLNYRTKNDAFASQICAWDISVPCDVWQSDRCPFTIFFDFIDLFDTDEVLLISGSERTPIRPEFGMPQIVLRSNTSAGSLKVNSRSKTFRMKASFSIDCPNPLSLASNISFLQNITLFESFPFRTVLDMVYDGPSSKFKKLKVSKLTCIEGGMWNFNLLNIVEKVPKTCTVPNVKNGYIIEINRTKGSLLFACDYSFQPFQPTRSACTNGEWIPELTCKEFQCPEPNTLANSTNLWQNAQYTYVSAVLDYKTLGNKLGSWAFYTCPSGTQLRGYRSYAVCLEDQTWSPTDIACLVVVGCYAEEVKNGFFKKLLTKVGDFSEIECNPNYTLIVEPKFCAFKDAKDGRKIAAWSRNDQLVCGRHNICASNPCGRNGKCLEMNEDYSCVCDEGYRFYRNATNEEQCRPINQCTEGWHLCSNGVCRMQENIAKFDCHCDEGMMEYDEKDADKAVIPNRSYLRHNQSCIRKRCRTPLNLLPESFHFVKNESNIYLQNTSVHIYCDGGVEHFELRCLANGMWDHNERLRCSKVECPKIILSSPTIQIVNPRNFNGINDIVHFACASKMDYLVGSSSIICRSNGEWSALPPKCIAPKCSEINLVQIANLLISYSSANLHENTTATLYCRLNNGTVAKSGEFLCTHVGDELLWTGDYSDCAEIEERSECEIQTPSDIMPSSRNIREGDDVHFECIQPNYILSDLTSLKCLPGHTLRPSAIVRQRRQVGSCAEQKLCIKDRHSLSAVYVGQSVNMYCQILPGCEHYRVRWINVATSQIISNSEMHGNTFIAYIESAEPTDQGEYLCEILNESGDVLDFSSWILKISTARRMKTWRETLASTRPATVLALDSRKDLNGWNASSHWNQLSDGSWTYSPLPFGFKDYLITPAVDVKSTWLGISVDLSECHGKCLVWLSYYSTNQSLETISADKFNTLGGATLDPDSHSINFVLPYSKVWILVTVDPNSSNSPLRLSSLRVTVTACAQIKLGLIVFPETTVSPSNRSIKGFCAVGNARPIASYSHLICGPQGLWSIMEGSATNRNVLQFSNCVCEEGFVENFGACVERGPLCYSCVTSANSNCTFNRDAHFCESGEVCRSRTQLLSPESEIGFVEKSCTPAFSCTTFFHSSLEKCMAGQEECTFCCTHDSCNWRPEKAIVEKRTTTSSTTTTATTTTTTTTSATSTAITTTTAKPTTTTSLALTTTSATPAMTFSAHISTCLDRQLMRIHCQKLLQIRMLMPPNFYEPTIVPFPVVEDNDPDFTLHSSLGFLSARHPYTFDGTERRIVWTVEDRHNFRSTCTTDVVFLNNSAVNSSERSVENSEILLNCPQKEFIDEHWNSSSSTVSMRLPSIKPIQNAGFSIFINHLSTVPSNGSFVEIDRPILVTVTASITRHTNKPLIERTTIMSKCQFWYKAVERGCPMWAIDVKEFVCNSSANVIVCFRRRPCASFQHESPDDFKTILCTPGQGGWRLVNDKVRAVQMSDTMPMKQLPLCLEEMSATITLSIDFGLENTPSKAMCILRLSATMRLELTHFFDLRCPVVGWHFNSSQEIFGSRLSFNFTTTHADADQVLVCIRHVTSNLAQDLPNFSLECKSSIRSHSILYHLRCPPGWGANRNLRCEKCPAGYFVLHDSCSLCPRGTFAAVAGSSNCTPCAQFTSTVDEGSTSLSKCIPLCPPGQFSLSSAGLAPCEQCPLGTYQPDFGQAICITCASSLGTHRRSSKSRNDCIPTCTPGNFLHVESTTSTKCVPCPKGYFQRDSDKFYCTKCPDGMTTSIESGANSHLFCKRMHCLEFGCSNRGICVGSSGVCSCDPGFTGFDCSVALNLCSAAHCLNGGMCTYFGAFVGNKCSCPKGTKGQRCEEVDADLFECTAQTILTSAFCRLQRKLSTTSSTLKRTGKLSLNSSSHSLACSNIEINACPNGKCVQGMCKCSEDFQFLSQTGKCLPKSACEHSQCFFTQQCLQLNWKFGGENFQCICPANRTGQFCEHSLAGDQCSEFNKCKNGGRCVFKSNKVGKNTFTVHCVCASGWSGPLCEVRDQNDPCASNPCGSYGICKRLESDFYCECIPGVYGEFCTVILNPCSIHANVSAQCLNGGICRSKGSSQQFALLATISLNTTFYCECPPHFTGNRCEKFMERKCENQTMCKNGGTCFETLSHGAQCNCASGFTGNQCEFRMDACEKLPYGDSAICGRDGNCVSNGDFYDFPYTCLCNAGWNSSTSCTSPENMCSGKNESFCSISKGICIPTQDKDNFGTKCVCLSRSYGTQCEKRTDYCNLADICQNGGTCVQKTTKNCTDLEFKCICPSEYTGPNCEFLFDPCTPNPCYNGATCKPNVFNNSYRCLCTNGYDSAHNCVTKFDPCVVDSELCGEGECRTFPNTSNAYCSCPPQYTGLRCEKKSYVDNYNIYFTGHSSPGQQKIFSTPMPFTESILEEGFTICGFAKVDGKFFGNFTKPVGRVESFPTFAVFGVLDENNSITVEIIRFTNFGVIFNLSSGHTVLLPYRISHNLWHNICVMYDGSVIDANLLVNYLVYMDGKFISGSRGVKTHISREFIQSARASLFLGDYVGTESFAKFVGELSYFEIYKGLLSNSELVEVWNNCRKGAQKFVHERMVSWYETDQTNFTTIDANSSHAMVIYPGICDNPEKTAPSVISCPNSQHLFEGGGGRKRLRSVSWDDRVEKMFSHSNGIIANISANFRSGQLFSPGKYRVLYVAMDLHGQTAVCDFEIVVANQNCSEPTYSKELNSLTRRSPPFISKRPSCDKKFNLKTAQFYHLSTVPPLEEIAELTCKSSSLIFSNPKPSFYVCDVMGYWDRFLPPSAAFNLPTCVSTTTVLQQLEGSVVFDGGNCSQVGNYLAAVSERIIYASKSFGGFCRMANCEGQLSLQNVCQNLTGYSLKNFDGFSLNQRNENVGNNRVKRNSPSVGGVLIKYKLSVNNTKHPVEPAIRDTMLSAFGERIFFKGGAKLSCTSSGFPLLHIKAVAPRKNGSEDLSSDKSSSLFSGSRTIFTIKKHVKNSSTGGMNNMVESQQLLLQCSTCGPGETWQSDSSTLENIPLSRVLDISEIVVWAAAAHAAVDDNVIGIGVDENFLLAARTGSCVRCPADTFKASAGVGKCMHCPVGETTGESIGCVRRSDCFLNCSSGTVYDIEINGCMPCPKGQYMPYSGRLKCIPCPIGVTTWTVGTKEFTDCSKTCEPGEELSINEDCVKCGLGTYRSFIWSPPLGKSRNILPALAFGSLQANLASGACERCPLGFNTSMEGATSLADCDRVFCPPGFRRKSHIGKVNAHDFSFVEVCESCGYSFYQDEYNANACKKCPSGLSTSAKVSISAEMCKAPEPIFCIPGLEEGVCPPFTECLLSSHLSIDQQNRIYECQKIFGASSIPIFSSRMLEFWLLFAFGIFSFLFTILLFYSFTIFRRRWIILCYRYCPAWLLCCKKMTVNDISGNDYMRDATHAPITREPATSVLIDDELLEEAENVTNGESSTDVGDYKTEKNSNEISLEKVGKIATEIPSKVSNSIKSEQTEEIRSPNFRRTDDDKLPRKGGSNVTRWSASDSDDAYSIIHGSSKRDNKESDNDVDGKNDSICDPLDEIRSSLIECLVSNDELELPMAVELDSPRNRRWKLTHSSSSPSLRSAASESRDGPQTGTKSASQKAIPAKLTVQTTMNQRENPEYDLHHQLNRENVNVDRREMLSSKAHCHSSDYGRATNAIGRRIFSADSDFEADETHKSIFNSGAFAHCRTPNPVPVLGNKLRNTHPQNRNMLAEGADNIDRQKYVPHTYDIIRTPPLSPEDYDYSRAQREFPLPRKRVFRKYTTRSGPRSPSSSSDEDSQKPSNFSKNQPNRLTGNWPVSPAGQRVSPLFRGSNQRNASKEPVPNLLLAPSFRKKLDTNKPQPPTISYDDDDDAFFS